MAAKARDAQAGWSIYRASGYSLEFDEINARLTAAGFNPVAPRTYTHYRELHRYGYQRTSRSTNSTSRRCGTRCGVDPFRRDSVPAPRASTFGSSRWVTTVCSRLTVNSSS